VWARASATTIPLKSRTTHLSLCRWCCPLYLAGWAGDKPHHGHSQQIWWGFRITHKFVKSCVIPIRCGQPQLEVVTQTHPCTRAEFPCSYLGLPISDKRLRKADLLIWIDKIGNKLSGWQASLMNMARRITWVRFILSTIPIYVLIAIKVPKWFIKVINKICWGFVWKGQDKADGGSCLVAWEKVQTLALGGLGILNLKYMS
jgi:hypothetical protein